MNRLALFLIALCLSLPALAERKRGAWTEHADGSVNVIVPNGHVKGGVKVSTKSVRLSWENLFSHPNQIQVDCRVRRPPT